MQKAGIFPSAEKGVDETVCVAEKAPSVAEGKFSAKLSVENVRDILRSWTVILIDIVLIEIVAVRKVAAVSIARINKRIFVDVGGESYGYSVVPTAGNGLGDGNVAQLGVERIKRARSAVVRARSCRWRLIDIRGVVVVNSTNVQVADIEDHAGTNFPFDIQTGMIHSLILPVIF